ncbi:MAG: FkbM family methyltransferase [Bauldia sp.]
MLPTERELELRRWMADGGDAGLRFNYALTRDSVVLDLGGYSGQFASDLYARMPCRLLIFEPVHAFFTAIQRRLEKNGDIAVYPFGLAGRTRKERVQVRGDATSIFSPDRGLAPTEEIELVDIVSFLDQHRLLEIDLIKINIEGGEYELLERLIESGAIHRLRSVQVQFHDVAPDSLAKMVAIRRGLEVSHRCDYSYQFVWESWTRKVPDAQQAFGFHGQAAGK